MTLGRKVHQGGGRQDLLAYSISSIESGEGERRYCGVQFTNWKA
jgi:hypothetical protein